jgi:serine/threonine-protein kinase
MHMHARSSTGIRGKKSTLMLGIDRSELGGCRLIRKIGAGAMGEVYLAEQVPLGNRLVAVKVVHAAHDVTPRHSGDGDEDAEWHFIREAQLLGRLTHPNILPVYHSGVEDGYLFLVMEYVQDGSLADAIKGKGAHKLDLPVNLPFVVDIVAQVANALQYTHEHQVIHADVKPSNVLVKREPDGRWHVLLADFGVARSTDTIALREEVAGTAAYMAPEQFYGHLSPTCDQYALGVMAYQLLAGRLPFSGGLLELVQAHAREDPPALRSLNPAVAPPVEAVIMRALAKQPEDRHRSVAAFAQALRTAATGADTTVVAANGPSAAWAAERAADRFGGATARTAPASPWTEPPRAATSTQYTYPPTVPLAPRAAASAPVAAHREEGDSPRRRLAPGLAVLALLLVTALAGIGLRSHIDVGHAFFSGGGTTQPPAAGAGVHTSSPTSPSGAVPTAQGPSGPGQAPTPTSPVQTTPPSSPEPTASVTASPTATAPDQPTATAVPKSTATVAPTASSTAAPEPTATATAAPPPVATTAPKPAVPPPSLPRPGMEQPAPVKP